MDRTGQWLAQSGLGLDQRGAALHRVANAVLPRQHLRFFGGQIKLLSRAKHCPVTRPADQIIRPGLRNQAGIF